MDATVTIWLGSVILEYYVIENALPVAVCEIIRHHDGIKQCIYMFAVY